MNQTVVRIVDQGVIGGEKQLHSVIEELTKRGYDKAIVAQNAEFISHWWALESENGKKVIYCGTEETFAAWQKRGVQ